MSHPPRAEELATFLETLRTRAGKPSLRQIADAAGDISHDTVRAALNASRLVSLQAAHSIIRGLGGDTADHQYATRLLSTPSPGTGTIHATIADDDLIGRGPEWTVLGRAVAATAGGAGGCLVLTGPAGIGKSHLARAAARAGARGGLTVAYRAAIEVDRNAPLISLAAALSDCDPPTSKLAWLREETPVQSTPERIGRELENLAAERPLLVIIDDAQWMDEFSVLAVRTLVPRLAFHAVRWLFVRRPGPGGAAMDALDDLVTMGAEEITVGPLADADVELLCARRVGAPVDATVLAQAERCGGNPLWIMQLLAGTVTRSRSSTTCCARSSTTRSRRRCATACTARSRRSPV
ncbi:AAA family ATPase [Catenuloplanes japonicus]|uniref:AAA family ATPase n=1 Tax=Catenuloplanes japonicus TaxID=33876 RepID=UPI000524B013|nr:ATP-binding protein [Catenuloplanes japonicus]